MKITLNVSDFRSEFARWSDYKNRFSYEGLGILFEYLEQYEQDTGEEMEMDVVGISCDWYEADWQSIASDYSIDDDIVDGWEDMNEDERKKNVLEWLNDRTMVAGETADGGIVYCTSF